MQSSFVTFMNKEWRHILRERRTLVMIFAIPLALVLLFGYVISTDIDHTPIAVLDSSHGDPLARKLMHKLSAADQFRIVDLVNCEADIDRAFKRGVVKMVVVIPSDIGSDARRYGGAEVQLVTDASDLNVATTVISYATAIISDLNAELNTQAGHLTADQPVLRTNVRMMYNPELKSAYMFVPGVIALIVMIVAAMMTSVTLAREKESGTLRLLTVSPLKAHTIVPHRRHYRADYGARHVGLRGAVLRHAVGSGAALLALYPRSHRPRHPHLVAGQNPTVGPHLVAAWAFPADYAPLGLHLPHQQHAAGDAGTLSGGARHLVYRRHQGTDAQGTDRHRTLAADDRAGRNDPRTGRRGTLDVRPPYTTPIDDATQHTIWRIITLENKNMDREESTRQQKVGRQIQKDISDIFLKEARHLVQGVMVTVSKVRVSPDLTFAKVYLSIFPFDKGETTLATLKENIPMIRYELGKRVRNQLRTVPEVAFALDDSLEYVDRIEKLIKA